MTKIIRQIREFSGRNELGQYLTKKYFNYGLVFFSLLLGFYLRWEMQSILEFSFIIWIVLHPTPSQLLARCALYSLSFTALLLMIKKGNNAEQFAIISYYFLGLAMITILIEFKKEQTGKHNRQ